MRKPRRVLRGPRSRRPILVRQVALEQCEQRLLLSIDAVPHAIEWLGEPAQAYAGQWILGLNGRQGALIDQQRLLGEELALLGLGSQVEIDTHLGASGLFRIHTQATDYADVLPWVARLSGFSYLEPDFELKLQALPNDLQFGNLYGLHNTGQSGGTPGADISAVEAWDITTGSSNVVVGVVDTGILYTHPDLAGNIWVNPHEIAGDNIDNDGNGYIDDVRGWDFFSNDANPMDFRSHGTHVAGTIGAVGNNGIGVTGVNWDVSLMALKISGDDPGGNGVSSSAATAALNYVADLRMNRGVNVRVTSHSWGGYGVSTALRTAIELNEAADILLVAAAGNDSLDTDASPHYPAAYTTPNIISVASTTRTDALSDFSNYGASSVDLGAPGSSVFSTVLSNGYGTKSGTSMATPHVAGVAALAWSFRPDATYQQVKDAILQGVDPLPSLSGITLSGGRLNAARTLQLLGLNAAPTAPAAGAVVSTAPVSFTIQFSSPVLAATLQASDLRVNEIPATSYQLDGPSQVTFGYAVSPVTAQGLQTIRMSQGAVLRASDGAALNALEATFRYDLTPLGVISMFPSNGSTVVYPLTQIELAFNEVLDPASVGLGDLSLSEGVVAQAELTAANVVLYTLSGIETEGSVSVSLAGGALTDTYGNPLVPFAATLQLDVAERALDNFRRVEPYGSLVFESRNNPGRIGTPLDVDVVRVDMRDGETLTAVVRPSNPLAAVTAFFQGLTAPVVGAPGAAVVVPLTAIVGDQAVRLEISASAVTDYQYDFLRNAQLEAPAAGQSVGLDITPSRVELAGTRFAIVATAAPLGVSTDEYLIDWTGAAGQRVDILLTGLDGTNLSGQVVQLRNPSNVIIATGTSLAGGDLHDAHRGILGFTIPAPGVYRIRVTSSVEGRYSLVVTQAALFATEPNSQPAGPARSLDGIGRAVGMLGTRLDDGTYTLALNTAQSTFVGAGSLSVPPDTTKYPLVEQSPGSLDGSATGNVVLRVEGPTVELLNTSAIDFVAKPGPFAPNNMAADLAGAIDLEGLLLQAALRNILATATTPKVLLTEGAFDLGGMRIVLTGGELDYEVPGLINANYELGGTVFFNQAGLTATLSTQPGQILLQAPILATINEEVEVAPGLMVAFELSLDGQLVAALPFGDAQDLHTLTLEAGQVVTIGAHAPSWGGLVNDLDPLLNVYLPGGTLLHTEAGSGASAVLTFIAPADGVYRVGVAAEDGYGEYDLTVDIAEPLELVTDAEDPGLSHLVWTGTAGADHVVFTQLSASAISVSLPRFGGVAVRGSVTLFGVTGRVLADGREGNDTIDGSALLVTAVRFQGGAGNDRVLGGGGDDVLLGDADGGEGGADYVHGGAGADLIYGDAPSVSSSGSDKLYGGDGDDIIYGDGDGAEGQADWISGGDGNDTIYGDHPTITVSGGDTIFGGAGDDTIYADAEQGAADEIYGGDGNDVIDTGGGGDLADGGAGNDLLLGGDGGEGAADTLSGGDGNDVLIGDARAQTPHFKAGGSDILRGDAGEDLLLAGHYLPALPGDVLLVYQAWIADEPFAARVAAIESSYFLLGTTVFNDRLAAPGAVKIIDSVLGGADQDWLLYDFAVDRPVDLEPDELAFAIDLAQAPRPSDWPS